MSEKNKSQYICFADFEFTCGYCINKNDSEILSAGIVICDENYRIQEKFYCTCRPKRFPKLTRQCRKLTKLTQEEIDNSPDSNDVMLIIVNLMKKYMINDIYVWGNFDRIALLSDVRQHQRFGKGFRNIQKISSKIVDIQADITEKTELPEPVNIKELALAFDYTPQGNFHNALNDALALYVIYKAVYTEDLTTNEKLAEIRTDRYEKIEQRRIEAEKRRKETAFSIPLSDGEKLYYEEIGENSEEAGEFIYMRSRFVRALQNNPDENDFILLYLKTQERIKVISKKKYNYTLQHLSEKAIVFERDDFSELILKECRNRDKVKV